MCFGIRAETPSELDCLLCAAKVMIGIIESDLSWRDMWLHISPGVIKWAIPLGKGSKALGGVRLTAQVKNNKNAFGLHPLCVGFGYPIGI